MKDFLQIIQIIQTARNRALSVVNSELVNLYWQVGQYVSQKLEQAKWGDGMVVELANYIQKNHPEIKGFDKKNLYRMCQFYQTYNDMLFVAPLVRQIQQPDNKCPIKNCYSKSYTNCFKTKIDYWEIGVVYINGVYLFGETNESVYKAVM